MTIELRVLTGARAGHRARFEGPAVTIGRHPGCDLQLDAQQDLDVSSRHAELRIATDGSATLTDLGSTNGTIVNGARVRAHSLRDGDVVQLGAEGPRVEVRLLAAGFGPRDAEPAHAGGSGGGAGSAQGETDSRRVQSARSPQPAARSVVLGAALLVAGIVGAYLIGARQSAAEVAELERLVARHGSMTAELQQRLRGMSDSSVLTALQQANDSLRTVVQAGSPADRAGARDEMTRRRDDVEALVAMDLPAINARNAAAVAYLVAEVDGRPHAGTAFAVTADGRMITNRHLVLGQDGARATRIAVKFRDRREWRAAHVVRVAEGETDDLALIQLADAAPVPTVLGIARDGASLAEGAAIATIGFPLGRATMMNGDGDDFVAKTSLYPGTVSKQLDGVLQIATFAGRGSSGSPVFDARGMVVGVMWGGPREAAGRLAYAVPAERVVALVASSVGAR